MKQWKTFCLAKRIAVNFFKNMEKSVSQIEVIAALKTVYDPEIPVNVYDLGLIYEIKIDKNNRVDIKMTLTAPNCPIADSLLDDVRNKVRDIDKVRGVNIDLVFLPAWEPSMMSEEAKLELGYL